METIYLAVTGTTHYYGADFLKPGLWLRLVKEPDNRHDPDAIRAELEPLGKIGYVANSPHTVPRGCRSAGRAYDQVGEAFYGVIRFIVRDTVIVEAAEEVTGWPIVSSPWEEEEPIRTPYPPSPGGGDKRKPLF
ncbi:HIRAN domain-containing protein [Paenibacillus sp. CC-CFT747]|nr:HIRAN domain-containing protein [Paenibacillus sp. CC-CFT747]